LCWTDERAIFSWFWPAGYITAVNVYASRLCQLSRQPPSIALAPRPGAIGHAEAAMVFTKRLREGIRRGRIRCSVRIWKNAHVKVGGRYQMDEGHIVVDSIEPITVKDITHDLARESGFESVDDLLQVAKHGSGDNVFLIRFHYLPPGAWDGPRWKRHS
jgi:hypothetical protein